MLKIYGSMMCPDCVECKKNLDLNNIEYEFIDINHNLSNLSSFLKIRDTNSIFDHIKEINDIGLPTLIDDEKIILDWESYLTNLGYKVTNNNEMACSINGKGC